PVLYLRLREAAREDRTKIVELTPHPTGLSDYAEVTLVYRPGEAATVIRSLLERPDRDPRLAQAAEVIGDGEGLVVILGRPSAAESAESIVDAAGVLAGAFPGAKFLSGLRRGNVHGALDMGMAPGILPGRVTLEEGHAWFLDCWGSLPEERGLDARGIFEAADNHRVQALVLVGADPLWDFPDRALARRGLDGMGFIVAVDCFLTDSNRQADVILPAATFGERAGTTTNMEGRVTRLGEKVTAPGTARPDWMIAAELALRMGHDLGFDSLDAIAD
ncbi:MAG: molybdopterin-dependent oxidoreductase, partial [Actinomycetota bacterium]|nr:molybdopterin-dependent oxidoreductase [Actinomycetota bacterium]